MIIDDKNRIFADPVGDTTGKYDGTWQFWAMEDQNGDVVILRSEFGADPGAAYNLLENIAGSEEAWKRCKIAKLVRQAIDEEQSTWIKLFPERWPQRKMTKEEKIAYIEYLRRPEFSACVSVAPDYYEDD